VVVINRLFSRVYREVHNTDYMPSLITETPVEGRKLAIKSLIIELNKIEKN